jgi:hypothetical protein
MDFDWHVVNSGGSGVGSPHPDSLIVGVGGFSGSDTPAANSDTTGHFTGLASGFEYYSGAPTRASLFSFSYAFNFEACQRIGANTSQIAVTNFTITVEYINTGVGSWLVQTSAMTNPTGSVDFVTFAPDIAQIENPNLTGTIETPIADTAGAFIYIDGGVVPVTSAGLPTGFTPDDTFVVTLIGSITLNGDTLDVVQGSAINISIDFADSPFGPGFPSDFQLTGMDLATLSAFVGTSFTTTMTTGSDPTSAALRLFFQSVSNSGWDSSQSVGIWGTYTIAAPSVISVTPSTGSINGGQSVTIRGTGFTAATGVEFGGIAATSVVIVDDETITAVTPAHLSGTVDVEVLSVATGTDLYTYVVETRRVPPIPTRTTVAQGGARRRG